MEHGFSWMQQISGLAFLELHTSTGMLVMLGLLVFAVRARQQLASATDVVVPDRGFSARNIAEVITEFITNLSESVIGHEGPKYVPLFASLFLFILGSNLIGLIPGFTPPTDNFNVTLALGVVAFLAYNYYGFRAHGLGYLKQFAGPLLLLAPLMIVVELFSHLFRPASLAIRLYGNMFADHLLLGIFTDLTKVIIPVIFYVLGTFVSLVQALVFTLLTMVYVGLAISHDH
ncbi:MAG: F0F1 ATP synthase subunit A [Myxococcales bacterium]|jgi:F-type H+-transporting ATPase subunit a|nr:F0F1 ATP synthase subunit A [Myxococcales bacterium]